MTGGYLSIQWYRAMKFLVVLLQLVDHVKKFKAGDIAGVGCLVDSCRECDNCNEGLEQHCLNGAVYTYSAYEKDGKTITQGGYSSKIVVDERFVLKISEKLSPEKAAPLLCAGITTYSPTQILECWQRT